MKKLTALKLTLAAAPLVFLLTVGLCWLTGAVAEAFGLHLPEQPSLDLVRNARGWELVGWIAATVIGAPVAEELIFRGLAFRLPLHLAGRRGRGRTATAAVAVVSSALFTAAHYLQMPFPNNAFVALFFLGLCQCALYRATGRIWSPMLNHALFNLTNIVLLFAAPGLTQ